jgi:hypothetical protein
MDRDSKRKSARPRLVASAAQPIFGIVDHVEWQKYKSNPGRFGGLMDRALTVFAVAIVGLAVIGACFATFLTMDAPPRPSFDARPSGGTRLLTL